MNVLVYHWRRDFSGCGCGWAELGRSWPEHVATVYEESVVARVAAPKRSVVEVLAMASDRTAMGLLGALDAAGYVVIAKPAPSPASPSDASS